MEKMIFVIKGFVIENYVKNYYKMMYRNNLLNFYK